MVRTVNAVLAEDGSDRTQRSACTQQVLHLAPRQITKAILLIPVNEGDAEVMPAAIRPLKVQLGNDTQRRTVMLEGIRTVKMKRPWHAPWRKATYLELKCEIFNPCVKEYMYLHIVTSGVHGRYGCNISRHGQFTEA